MGRILLRLYIISCTIIVGFAGYFNISTVGTLPTLNYETRTNIIIALVLAFLIKLIYLIFHDSPSKFRRVLWWINMAINIIPILLGGLRLLMKDPSITHTTSDYIVLVISSFTNVIIDCLVFVIRWAIKLYQDGDMNVDSESPKKHPENKKSDEMVKQKNTNGSEDSESTSTTLSQNSMKSKPSFPDEILNKIGFKPEEDDESNDNQEHEENFQQPPKFVSK